MIPPRTRPDIFFLNKNLRLAKTTIPDAADRTKNSKVISMGNHEKRGSALYFPAKRKRTKRTSNEKRSLLVKARELLFTEEPQLKIFL